MAQTQSHPVGAALKNLLLIVLIIAASIGGTLFYTSRSDESVAKAAEPPKQAKPVLPSPIYVALDPFTVTLQDNYGRRILYTAITLRVTDQKSAKLLSDYMPEVRSRTLLTLSEQSPQTVQTPEGRTMLAKALTNTLEAPYTPNPSGPKISNVLFTAFVVQ